MLKLDQTADELSDALLSNALHSNVCMLDSSGVGYLSSHLLVAGIEPIEIHELANADPETTLAQFADLLSKGCAAIFSISYDFGRKLGPSNSVISGNSEEPDVFVALFDTLAVHDYSSNVTYLTGKPNEFERTRIRIGEPSRSSAIGHGTSNIRSNFSRSDYLDAVETIREYIRCGDTYQTNLTQQFEIELAKGLTAEAIFERLRRDHPAPFAAFLKRLSSTVVSASPERFFKIDNRKISASPIKGTRKRGITTQQDDLLRRKLTRSEKDRAENTMIVDLLRNDLGRVCEYGSVEVESLCEVETHPTFHHMVSTINGRLRTEVGFADIIRALFPCGSITGAPKIRTMQIIDELENVPRGLSMGAIGYYIPEFGFEGLTPGLDLSVAIRTMVVSENRAVFNVGGGITIDSDPVSEYDESMLKAKALFAALEQNLGLGV